MKKIKYAEITVRVLVPEDQLDEENDPFEDPLENLISLIKTVEIDGLSHHENVEIQVEE